ncbi:MULTISPECIES: N-acetyl-gamma-glutamyl-phosphate reductase [Bacillus]|uniref:N-acetyl-gamma-glutamyl-phosphate reductase n=1 Tax=Bacillus TaxID=1386 RepID=UPI0002D43E13|nr:MULTISPECIES: N-acetyl-gamma-glutamyl-phosphate reductase [Bacillus]
MNVSIIGASGYSGLELIRLLNNHPKFNIVSLHSSSKAGQFIHGENPHLMHITQKFQEIDPNEIAKNSDLVFLATPSGVSAKLAQSLVDTGIKVIDLSGDLRLKKDGLYKEWYKKEAAPSETIEKAVYGLSEWNTENIQKAQVIANPGCYATAVLLGLAPLSQQQLIKKNSIIIDAKSGVSGAGRTASLGSMYTEVNENLKIYKVHEHQHIPEIEQQLKWWNDDSIIEFSTHLTPMTRGIMATMYVELMENHNTKQLIDLYKQAYERHPFVRIQEEGFFPSTKQVSGSNFCDIAVSVNERSSRVTIVSVIDNLMKGAAGQAVQNANLMCGFAETTGLMFVPQFP